MNGTDDQNQQNPLEQMQQQAQFEQMKKVLMAKILTKEAYERLSRVRMVNPHLAAQVELYLLQVYQQGKLQNRITDEQLKQVLQTVSEKKEFTIRRR